MMGADPLQPEIDRAARRARLYSVEDGLAEISGGGVFLLVGLYFLLQALLPPRPLVTALSSVAFPILLIGAAFASQRLLRAAKDRYVHPRTGYVGFRRRRGQRALTGFLAGLLMGLVIGLVQGNPLLQSWVPAFEGLVIAAAFLVAGARTGLLRFPIAGLLAAGMGLLLSVLRVGQTAALAVFFGWLGLILVSSGTIAFRSYLRRTAGERP